jgi:hypothetical protein
MPLFVYIPAAYRVYLGFIPGQIEVLERKRGIQGNNNRGDYGNQDDKKDLCPNMYFPGHPLLYSKENDINVSTL